MFTTPLHVTLDEDSNFSIRFFQPNLEIIIKGKCPHTTFPAAQFPVTRSFPRSFQAINLASDIIVRLGYCHPSLSICCPRFGERVVASTSWVTYPIGHIPHKQVLKDSSSVSKKFPALIETEWLNTLFTKTNHCTLSAARELKQTA